MGAEAKGAEPMTAAQLKSTPTEELRALQLEIERELAARSEARRDRAAGPVWRWVRRFANSPRWILVACAVVVAGSTWGYSRFEGAGIGESLYWTLITATTVGYGDLTAATFEGRVISVVLVSVTILFLVPLFAAHMVTRLLEDRDAWTHHEQEQLMRDVRALVERSEGSRPYGSGTSGNG